MPPIPPSSRAGVPPAVKGLSLVSLFNDFASEMIYPLLPAFVTGTLGGVTPVTRVAGRLIADGKAGAITKEASDLYLRSVGAT